MTAPLTAAELAEARRLLETIVLVPRAHFGQASGSAAREWINAARTLLPKLIAEVERLTASDPYTAGLNDGIGQAHRRIAELEAQLADYESDRRRVYAEPCDLPPDEKHCSCVAPQREEIKRLNAQLKAVRSASDECIDVVVGQKELLKQRIAELEAQLAAAQEYHASFALKAFDEAKASMKRRAIEIINKHRERVSAMTIHGVVDTDGVLLKVSEEIEAL